MRETSKVKSQTSDENRGSSAQRGYGARWQKAREAYLRKYPLCAWCETEGRITQATVVDHITPHKGDMVLFWDSANWQGLCDNHHNSHKQRLEKTGKMIGCDERGMPIDPSHHWRKW